MAKKKIDVVSIVDLRNAFYQAGDPRRRIDEMNADIVRYDYNAMSNLPSEGFQRYAPGRPWNSIYHEEE